MEKNMQNELEIEIIYIYILYIQILVSCSYGILGTSLRASSLSGFGVEGR